jgi:hypothetical protein
VRHIAHRCGGSLAQCDLIHLTFTEAALRARRARLGHGSAPHASRRAGPIDYWSGVWERDRDIKKPQHF